MKPIIQKLWVSIAMLCLSTYASAYDFEVDGIAYTITSFSELTCSVDVSDAPYEGEIAIPSEVMFNGKNLTVTSISNSAFKNSHVTSIQLPMTVIEIEASAFANCENLHSVILEEGLKSIGNSAFDGCISLSNIDFPNSLETIGKYGFANCKSLSQIALTSGISSLGESAFMNCESVSKVCLGNISVLESNVFNGCISLYEIECGNKLQQIKECAFANCGFTKFVIPNTVTSIGTNILRGNKNLQSFTIGNGITKISSDPIAQCPNVVEFIIADGSIELTLDYSSGDYVKIETDRATSSNEYWEYKYYYTRPGAYSSSTFENVYVGRPLSNPSYTDKSGASGWPGSGYYDYWYYYYTLPAFYGNKTIKSITIGPNVVGLYGVGFSCKHSSFYYGWLEGCSNIETLKISGLTDIPKLFTKDAISLKAVELPNTTLTVGEKAFYNCASMETIMFGSKLSTIGANALDNCEGLTSIYCKSKTPPTYTTGFNKDAYLNCHLYIPFETEQAYKSASPWDNFWNMSESQECVSEFEVDDLIYSVMSNNNVIVSGNTIPDECDIVIPSHVTYFSSDYNVIGIGEGSFKYAPIKSIVIPGCVLNIYNDVFNGCSKLKSIEMGYSNKAVILGHKSALQLSNSITPYPNASTVDEKRTGFRNGYYDGLFYGLPIEHLVINRDIELPKYYERTMGSSTSNYSTVYNDIIYFPPFYGLTNLRSVEIGENVSSICKNQIEAVVNAVPITMEYTNFGKCDNIEVVVSNNPTAPIGGGFTQTVYNNATLFLPNGGEESYKSDDYWKHFSHIENTPFIATESLIFEDDEIILDINENKTLMPIINPEDASIKTLKWSSSAPSIIAVSGDGSILSNTREGEAIITASTCDGTGISASVKVVVQKGAGVSDVLVDAPYKVSVENRHIHIGGKSDSDIVEIFNIQGQLIISSSDNVIDIHTTGIYIVKIGSFTYKVVM